MAETRSGEGATVDGFRSFLLLLFVIGVVGTGAELLLLGHTEDLWQWVPLMLMAASLVTLGWRVVARGSTSLRIFQGTTILFVLSGVVGLWLHYHGNAEFELEMYPALQGFELFWESVTGATPALAPGTMVELGLLGLVYTYRHPAFGNV
ncbi:MAG: hypothetical protein E2P06_02045 [Acidobacteria bacterium]|nr:MAG: hypothetical protein E2P06_02045 [Acidobacteriota bacterium]